RWATSHPASMRKDYTNKEWLPEKNPTVNRCNSRICVSIILVELIKNMNPNMDLLSVMRQCAASCLSGANKVALV
ncbi:hypothetical protein ABID22_002153, partial [Pontibacter aydingkolensis]